MKKINIAFMLAALAFIPLSSQVIAQTKIASQNASFSRPEVAKKVMAWQGEEGVQVWILRYGPRQDNKALVQITNIDHPWSQRIQIMDVQKSDKKSSYSLTVNGNRFVALNIFNRDSGELYLPDEKQPYRINYSESLSSYGNAQHFLTEYLNQKK
ncbi:hypothetical protein LQ939_09995 [Pantoea alhagi]|uniref:hypothetical protein n=1 Tax=Pantoea alhagi TaxID=1891675 RepID=UPI00202B7AB9|nr:hypothetical protein [Pantoea alhagi]URQ59193.1 hypothetical protein LQ939_09995 [Pantoea alhagi]